MWSMMLGVTVGCGDSGAGGAVELPKLVHVEGFMTVWGNPLLTRVELEKLTTVGGSSM